MAIWRVRQNQMKYRIKQQFWSQSPSALFTACHWLAEKLYCFYRRCRQNKRSCFTVAL